MRSASHHAFGFGALGAAVAVSLGVVLPSCGAKPSAGFDDGGGDASDIEIGPLCGHQDCDGDGYVSPADCNDNNAQVGPEAYDFPGDGIDNDCDGTTDNPVETCETVPTTAPGTPADFARAADLCAQRSKTKDGTVFDPLIMAAWGSVSGLGPGQTLWTSTTKPEQQTNIVSSFGMNATRRGLTMFGLANGPWGTQTPRESPALDPSTFRINDACAAIPLTGMDCLTLSDGASAGGLSVQDWAELKIWLKVPANAQALSFDFSFFTTEFNQFWHDAFNDAFFVLVTSSKLNGANVATDAMGLGVTVNSGFFQLCPVSPGPAGIDKTNALVDCVGNSGDAQQLVFGALAGTFYDGAGSAPYDGTALSFDMTKKYVYGGGTGWLTAKFPVTPGESFTMRIIVHDTFDGLKDSAILFDALRWEPSSSGGGVTRPPR
jgi:hypothetical protein